MDSIVLATNNPGKIKDYLALSKDASFKLIPQTEWHLDSVEETGTTFVENAIIKARYACEKTGLPALGEDSGLVVDALSGAPGLYSARYAGKNASASENIAKLLQELKDIPKAERTARFYAVIVNLQSATDPAPLICEGFWEGEILEEPRGQNGFGFLPIFYDLVYNKAAAELDDEIRHTISHRALAFQKLMQKKINK